MCRRSLGAAPVMMGVMHETITAYRELVKRCDHVPVAILVCDEALKCFGARMVRTSAWIARFSGGARRSGSRWTVRKGPTDENKHPGLRLDLGIELDIVVEIPCDLVYRPDVHGLPVKMDR